jgi:hypothetical protein
MNSRELCFSNTLLHRFAHRYLDLDNRAAIPGEEIYIPQHPGGRSKEIALYDSSESGGVCRVREMVNSCVGGYYSDVAYTCDSEGRSSGSPVIAVSTNKVIALHHCGTGGCEGGNMGVPVNLLYEQVAPFVYPPPPFSCDQKIFQLNLTTDDLGMETFWQVRDDTNTVVASGDGYYDNIEYEEKACLPEGMRYTLTIYDRYGDGMCCVMGIGSYQAFWDGEPVASGDHFGKSVSHEFGEAPETLPPVVCEDDPDWYFVEEQKRKQKHKTCSWIAEQPAKRCLMRYKAADRSTPWDGCPKACGSCTS